MLHRINMILMFHLEWKRMKPDGKLSGEEDGRNCHQKSNSPCHHNFQQSLFPVSSFFKWLDDSYVPISGGIIHASFKYMGAVIYHRQRCYRWLKSTMVVLNLPDIRNHCQSETTDSCRQLRQENIDDAVNRSKSPIPVNVQRNVLARASILSFVSKFN